MFYDEEELLEAVDILVEDYGFDEDEAIDLLMEDYEDELLEEVEFLIENYGFDEDEAIDLIIEDFKYSRDKQKTTTVKYKGANPDGRGLLTKQNKFILNRQTEKPTVSIKGGVDSINKGNVSSKDLGKIFRNNANAILSKELADHNNEDRIFGPSSKERSAIELAKHKKVDKKYRDKDIEKSKKFDKKYNDNNPNSSFKSKVAERKENSYNAAEKIYNDHKLQRAAKSGNTKLNSKAKIVGGTALAAAGGAYLTHKAYRKHKENKRLKNRIKRKLGMR